MNHYKKIVSQEHSGFTLVEVLASIVLLTLIFVSIFMIFMQTAKMNQTSEEIINATYLAQKEMEQIYELSKNNEPLTHTLGYAKQQDSDRWSVFQKAIPNDFDRLIQIRMQDTDDEMTRVVVEIINKEDAKKEAVMENLLPTWGWAE